MRKSVIVALCVAILAAGGAAVKAAKTAAELEKEKALANPFANDLGPDHIDVSGYPKQYQEGYKLLTQRCSRCHTPSRPLNSQFVESEGKDMAAREKSLEAWKKSDPDIFKDKNVWQPESGIWQRYVKRMMSKPGCEMSKDDAKKIWEFVAYDSRLRKLGANKAKWAEHRKKLLAEFKTKYPARYKELYESGSGAAN